MGIAELSNQYWDLQMRFAPENATMYGDHRFDSEISDVTPDSLSRVMVELRDVARQAETIIPGSLSKQDRITRQMLIDAVDSSETAIDELGLMLRIDPMLGVHSMLIAGSSMTVADQPEHANMLLERYRKVGGLVEGHLAWHLKGLAQGKVSPTGNIERSLAQMDTYLASSLETDPFINIVVPEWSGKDAWIAAMTDVVKTSVRPAIQKYRDTIRDEIAPHGRSQDRAGLSWVDGGAEYYERLIKDFTTVALTADEIHEIGLEEMAHSLEEFSMYGQAALGISALPALFDRLRTDETLRFDSTEELMEFNRTVITKAEALASDWFGHLPQAPCEMAEIPASLAPNMPPAYYFPPPADGSRPGTYFINTANPKTVHRFDMVATAAHEAVPGHHLQCAINAEAGDLPMFRRYGLVVAYSEGWGLYSERLADEMGLYESDLDRIGMVAADAWRAARLVVDTGIHAKGWSRDQAIAYMTENTPIKHDTVAIEVDRYIGFPGQALTYKIGQREFRRLRSMAEDRLGDRFDIRSFHDTVLTNGAVTLPVLAGLVEEWIASIV
ncbi:MAG: DUF885 domain-containing protein [Acidimicrobiia bacterium]|nr:DUF885 domain-containing protein [Acidimicrobiia bacterium]